METRRELVDELRKAHAFLASDLHTSEKSVEKAREALRACNQGLRGLSADDLKYVMSMTRQIPSHLNLKPEDVKQANRAKAEWISEAAVRGDVLGSLKKRLENSGALGDLRIQALEKKSIALDSDFESLERAAASEYAGDELDRCLAQIRRNKEEAKHDIDQAVAKLHHIAFVCKKLAVYLGRRETTGIGSDPTVQSAEATVLDLIATAEAFQMFMSRLSAEVLSIEPRFKALLQVPRFKRALEDLPEKLLNSKPASFQLLDDLQEQYKKLVAALDLSDKEKATVEEYYSRYLDAMGPSRNPEMLSNYELGSNYRAVLINVRLYMDLVRTQESDALSQTTDAFDNLQAMVPKEFLEADRQAAARRLIDLNEKSALRIATMCALRASEAYAALSAMERLAKAALSQLQTMLTHAEAVLFLELLVKARGTQSFARHLNPFQNKSFLKLLEMPKRAQVDLEYSAIKARAEDATITGGKRGSKRSRSKSSSSKSRHKHRGASQSKRRAK